MKKENIACCGLDCELCQRKFSEIREKFSSLDDAFGALNVEEMVKVIPFMKSKYKGYQKLAAFFSETCPGCRKKGGNPFCGVRKCASKKGFYTCAECEDLCKKFNMLFKVHSDGEIQRNIEHIRTVGLETE